MFYVKGNVYAAVMLRIPSYSVTVLLFFSVSAHAVISLDASAGWSAITYASPGPLGPVQSDFIGDQGTGQGSSDIIGSANDADPFYAGFYKAYNDNSGSMDINTHEIAFRIRLAEKGTTSYGGVAGYAKYAILGIDVGGDGALDLFVAANSQNIKYYATGDDLNISPNTTSVSELPTYAQSVGGQNTLSPSLFTYLPVDSTTDPATPTVTDLDAGGNPDYFLSFKLSMATVIAAYEESYRITNNITDPAAEIPTLDLATSLSFLAATSTQPNAYNQDLNGYDNQGGAVSKNDTTTWVELGASSEPFTADGESPVPESSAFAAMAGFLVFIAVAGRRRYS